MEKLWESVINEEWVLELKLKKVEITSKTKPCSSGAETRDVEIEHLGRDGEWW